MLGNGWTYSKLGNTKQSVDHYTSSRILRNYPAKWGIMLREGWTYPIYGHTKQSVDHYSQVHRSAQTGRARLRGGQGSARAYSTAWEEEGRGCVVCPA